MRFFRSRIRTLHRLWGAWGWLGVVGALALSAAAVLQLSTAVWRADEIDELAKIDEIRSSQRLRMALRDRETDKSQQRLTPAQWAAELPGSSLRQQRLGDLLEVAVRSGLTMDRTEQSLVNGPIDALDRMRVTMPVSGSYAQVRSFIGEALRQDCGLSLDSLKLTRASIATGDVAADLVWTLHGRRPSREAGSSLQSGPAASGAVSTLPAQPRILGEPLK